MRIGVIGLGAIGGKIACQLQFRAGDRHVLGLAAGRHASAVREHGLGDYKLRFRFEHVAETLPPLDGPYDLVLLCTRADATREALTPAAPLLSQTGAVVCIQNGFPEERAAAVVGAERVLGGVVGWSGSVHAGHDGALFLQSTGGGKLTLGAFVPPNTARLSVAYGVLSQVIGVRKTDNLAGARWSKLAMNCAMSTLGAISGLTLGELAARRDARELALAIVGEVVEVATAKGVVLEPVAGIRPDRLVKLPRALQHAAIWLAARRRPGQQTGMIARLREGRPAGVEELNALIDRPLNARLVEMVHEIERGVRKIDPGNLSAAR